MPSESPASRDARFRVLQKCLDTLGIKHVNTKLGPPDKQVPAIEIQHGAGHKVFALDAPNSLLLVYPVNFEAADKDRLEEAFKKQRKDWDRLIMTLRQEILQGRSGFVFEFEREGRISHFRLEQRWIAGTDPAAQQRLFDGIQELVVAAMRGGSVLGMALDAKQAPATTATVSKEPHPGMYT